METVLFRFEKFDFTKCEVHVSCPHCFALSKWSIESTLESAVTAFECQHCPFSGGVRLGPAAIEEYQTWKAGNVSGNPVYGNTIVGRKIPPPLTDHEVGEFYKNAYQNAAAAIAQPKGPICSGGPIGITGVTGAGADIASLEVMRRKKMQEFYEFLKGLPQETRDRLGVQLPPD